MDLKSRIMDFIDYKGVSIRAFEKNVGVSNGYVKSIRKGIGTEVLSNILEQYPELSRDWLLYGEGSMLKSASDTAEDSEDEPLTESNSIKYYYDMVATASDIEGFTDSEQHQPFRYMNIPGFEGCVGFNVSGDSMAPTAKHNDIVAIDRRTADIIVNGEIYLIVTRDGQRMIKRLVCIGTNDDNTPQYRCISDNPNQDLYAPFVISGDRIHTVSRVRGFISKTLLG